MKYTAKQLQQDSDLLVTATVALQSIVNDIWHDDILPQFKEAIKEEYSPEDSKAYVCNMRLTEPFKIKKGTGMKQHAVTLTCIHMVPITNWEEDWQKVFGADTARAIVEKLTQALKHYIADAASIAGYRSFRDLPGRLHTKPLTLELRQAAYSTADERLVAKEQSAAILCDLIIGDFWLETAEPFKTAHDWAQEEGVVIYDPDGWRTDDVTLDDLITENDYRQRLSKSTVGPLRMR